ncbi:MAG: amino acid permease [Planctomycetales bacterium]|nr:amino acid permease [Planctomycetales bacterium]MBN8624820.1 amino acid permease [Planctomycetota bacterium]
MQSEEITQEPAVLPRVLGSFDAAMIVVGSVIGSGIFLKPHTLAEALPNFGPIVAVWIGVGLITLCGCLSLAELAAMLPQAGGPYVYLREAYGKLPAFLWAWTEFWVVRTGSIGALAVATAIYLAEVTPLGRLGQEVVAVVLVVGLSAINYVSTRWTAHVQNVTTVLKVAFLGMIIVLPFLLGRSDAELLQPLFPSKIEPSLWTGLAAAVVAILWAYDGWINIGPVVEEIRDPQRNVPRALAWGITLIMAIYIAATFAYHLVLPHAEIAASEAPTATLFAKLFSPEAARWVSLGVMLSAFGAVNSNMLTGPRIYFAVARDGLLPHFMQKIHHRYETPHNAVLVQAVWTILLIVAVFHHNEQKSPLDAFDALTNYVIFGGYTFYALAVSAVFTLRVKRPDLPRPYKTWGYPVVPAIFLLAFGAFVVSMGVTSPEESRAGLALIAAGVPFFFWMRSRRPSVATSA